MAGFSRTPLAFCSLAVIVLGILPGCASRGPSPTRLTYIQMFETGQYANAYGASAAAADKASGTTRNEAALVAGLSAQALNRNAEAVRWLRPLAASPDPTLAGKSNAALGLIAAERGEHEEAARMLTIAGEKLAGDESARASMYAGDSWGSLGQRENATAAYTHAQQRVTSDDGLRIMIGDRLRAGPNAPATTTATAPIGAIPSRGPTLTVQIGAWTSLSTARRQAQKVARTANVRIVPILKDNKRLYAVRVGKFSSREAAEQVKGIVGGSAVVTAASGE